MKLTMLGTGHATVTKCYNTCFVLSDGDKHFLVDGGGGNGVLRQLKDAKIPITSIHDVFLTHKHTDHLLGIVWVLRVIASKIHQGLYEGDLKVYGHDEVLKILLDIAKALLAKKDLALFGDKIKFLEIKDGQTIEIIGHLTTFFDIDSTKAKQFGFTFALNEKDILCCCGDEPLKEGLYHYGRNSTYLLHEAFCLYENRDIYKPYEKHHSTAKDASILAQTLNVKNLVLYHTEDDTLKERKDLYTREGKKYFDGNIIVPDDLETITL